jgi:hypothetical protein
MSELITDEVLAEQAKLVAEAIREAARGGRDFTVSVPDTVGTFTYGPHGLATLFERLVERNLELHSALTVAAEWATGRIDDPAHEDQRKIGKALRWEGYGK